MKAPINSKKHIIQTTETAVASATVLSIVLAHAVAIQNVNTAQEVVEGAVVKAIYLEYWFRSNVTNGASFVAIVEKAIGQAGNPTFTEMTTLDAYKNKKNVLYTTQGLVAGSGDNPQPLMRQWIKIPRGKQRMGLDDQIRIHFAALGANALLGCGLTIYKSYQ